MTDTKLKNKINKKKFNSITQRPRFGAGGLGLDNL